MTFDLTGRRVALYGFGVTNIAVARALLSRNIEFVALDDRPNARQLAAAAELGIELVIPRSDHDRSADIEAALADVDVLINAPGLPEHHAVFQIAGTMEIPILSEFDLAQEWDDRPLLSITGTNGKTTVTMLVTAMLRESGLKAEAVGNTEVPLVAVLDDASIDAFVVESSSFRLAATRRFEPRVATWLNFAEDHLDVHGSLAGYEAAKARSWTDLGPSSIAVANRDDAVVAAHIGTGDATFHTYGLSPAGPTWSYADFTVIDGRLTTPDGDIIIAVDEMHRSMPHDVSNALAASATALAGGATLDGVRAALRTFEGLAHRVQLVGEVDGVSWYDDSKATAPHAVIAAVEGFSSVVLIAGGRNKGLDLSTLGVLAPRVRAVVGIGEAAAEVVAAFPGTVGHIATSMAEAVSLAARLAQTGDAVLLSPGCASFDWYENYGARGDHFAELVSQLVKESC